MIPCHDQPDSTNQDFFNMSSFEGLRKGIFFLTMRTETILLGGCQRCCWKLKPSVLLGEIEKGGRLLFGFIWFIWFGWFSAKESWRSLKYSPFLTSFLSQIFASSG